MAPSRYKKPDGWKGGSDDFTIMGQGMGGRIGFNDDTDVDRELLRNQANAKPAGEDWGDW